MDLAVVDTGRSSVTAAILTKAVGLLVCACPSLKSISYEGDLSPALLRALGEGCPQLSEITLPGLATLPPLQEMLSLLPSLLPHVSTLAMPDIMLELPDFSHLLTVTSLKLGFDFAFESDADWLRLPPKLQHLQCGDIEHGPPVLASDGSNLLSSLLSLQLLDKHISRDVLAQLLRASPSLQAISSWPGHATADLYIRCRMQPSTHADLSFLLALGKPLVTNAIFHINCSAVSTLHNEAQPLIDNPSFIASLPRMTGIQRCSLSECERGQLAQFLPMFPDVRQLILSHPTGIDDFELQGWQRARSSHTSSCCSARA